MAPVACPKPSKRMIIPMVMSLPKSVSYAYRRIWFFRTIYDTQIFEEPSTVENTSILMVSLSFDL